MEHPRRLVIGTTAVAVALVIGSTLGYLYYYQPVRGDGSVSTTTIDAGQGVQFGYTPNQGLSPFRYSWDFGDGGVSSERSPLHSYNAPGTYGSTVTVSDTAGKTTSWTTTITVNAHPSVEGAVSASIGVSSLNASFSAQVQGGTPGYAYLWQFGDGTTSQVQNPTHRYSIGNYTARLVTTDATGMTASWTGSITVKWPLTVGLTCHLDPYILYTEDFSCTPAQGLAPYTFYWDFGDGQSSTVQNPSHYLVPGSHTITLTVGDFAGETVHKQVTINITP